MFEQDCNHQPEYYSYYTTYYLLLTTSTTTTTTTTTTTKVPTWTDEKHSQNGEDKRWRRSEMEKVRREKMQVREKVGKFR